jgi:prevent-host-death family protein
MPSQAANHHRTIPARELSRNIADVLDDVEIERKTLLVTRNGRPVARLAPLNKTSVQDLTGFAVFVLTPLQEQILEVAAARAPQSTSSFAHLAKDPLLALHAAGKLERNGLLERDLGSYRITEKGQLVVAELRAP